MNQLKLSRILGIYGIIIFLLTKMYRTENMSCSKSIRNFIVVYDLIIFILISIKLIFLFIEISC